jgi:hypothetical protein
MRFIKRLSFFAVLCMATLAFSCGWGEGANGGGSPLPRVFFVTLSIRNDTTSPADITLYAQDVMSFGNDLVWGVYKDEGADEYQSADKITLSPGMSEKMFVSDESYTHSNQRGIALVSFLLKVDDKYYAGWDVSKYGNMVYFDDIDVTKLPLAGSGYGYVIGEGAEDVGQWHSTLSPYTKTLSEFCQISATYSVRITDTGAVFDSVEIVVPSSHLTTEYEYHP